MEREENRRTADALKVDIEQGASARLRTPALCLTLLLTAQLVLMYCAWAMPSFRLPVVVASIAVFVVALFALRWLTSRMERAIAECANARSTQTDSETRAIAQLAEQMKPLLDGDLRARASVADQEQAASVAKIVNHLVTELRWLVGRFQEIGGRIDALVELPRKELRELHSEYRGQAAEIHESANALAAMTSAMSSLSAATRHASGQARQAAEESSRAAKLISGNEDRVLSIREAAGNATRLLRRLSRTANSVDTHMGSMVDVARRADLIALNSTLQVTTRSSGNVELSRLSEEVSELAAVLGTTSSDVAFLVGTIHQDAVDAMAAMQQTNQDLSEGFDQLDQLGSTLSSVMRSSTDLHALVDEMAEKTLLQTGVVKRVYSRMVSINDLSDSYTSGARAWSTSLDELQSLALELRSSVADFQQPQVPEPRPDQNPDLSSAVREQKSGVLTDGL